MTPTVRRATREDIGRLLELLMQVEGVHQKGRPDLFRVNGTKYTETELADVLDNDETPVFVAVYDNRVVGYVFCIITEIRNSTMMFDHKNVHLEDVCIDENYRGMGIGGILMDFVTDYARSAGCTHMDLDVWEFNDGARRFYERFGFGTQKRRMDKWL